MPGGNVRLAVVAGERALLVPEETHGFEGPLVDLDGLRVRCCRPTPLAAARIRELVPALRPRPLGAHGSSFGFGDRVGLATPGHVRALRASGSQLAPVLAQQSARELERTGRSFTEVLDGATWGALESGWTSGYGADADHLRSETDVSAAVAAGFTMLTLDPSDHVDHTAATIHGVALEERVSALPWQALEDDWPAMRRRHARLGSDLEIARAAAVFGRALVQVASLARVAEASANEPDLDLEVSVDETTRPTTALEHAFLAVELRRLGVRFTGLAPRFPGEWEKGVELRGGREAVSDALATHARVAREHGGYRVSVHSGSDKFSVYPLLADHQASAWHVKTSGTSYLEALRVVAAVEPELFRDVLRVAEAHFGEDRHTYAVGRTAGVPEPTSVADAELSALLDDDDARQCLHVTFGSVLSDAALAAALRRVLVAADDAYANALVAHFRRHLEPLRRLR